MAGPGRDAGESIAALELVLEHARRYLGDLDEAPVRRADSDEAARRARGSLPEDGDGTLDALTKLIELSDGARVVSSGPRFFHWVIGGATPAALGADWLTAVLDQNAGGWDATPLATELETISIDWLLDLFGLPDSWGGVLVTGATVANFTGLAAARSWWARRHGIDLELSGFEGLPAAPVLTSGFVHVSALKSLAMLGLGRGRPTICAADETGRRASRFRHRRRPQVAQRPVRLRLRLRARTGAARGNLQRGG